MSDHQGRRPPVEAIDPTIAEKSVIGFALRFPSRMYQCQQIKPEHFSDVQFGEVWRIITNEFESKGTGITPTLIAELMVRNGVANKTTAAMLLVECQDHARNAPDPESAGATYAGQLIDYGLRRELKRAATSLNAVANEAVDTNEIRIQAQEAVYGVLNYETISQQKSLAAHLQEMITGLSSDAPAPAGVQQLGLMSGIPDLDAVWNGCLPGAMITIMARPSVGKTALGTQLAAYWAKQGKRGVLWSLEMYAHELAPRMACQICGIDSYTVSRNAFKGDERFRFIEALKEIAGWVGEEDRRLHIADGSRTDGKSSRKSVQNIYAEAMHWRNRMQLDYLMVDYLQLVTGIRMRGENREREVANVSSTLKQMGQNLRVPIIVMCQAGRLGKDQPNRRPRMDDARESGQIEADTDVMLIVHNEDFADRYNQEAGHVRAERERAEINVAKHRNGRTGIVKVDFVTACGRFEPSSPFTGMAGNDFGSTKQPWEQ